MANGTFVKTADHSTTFTTWDYDTIPPPAINPSTTFTLSKIQWSDTIDSGTNPRFRQQIRDHMNAGTHNNRDRFRIRGHYTGMAETTWVRKSNSKRYIKRRISGYLLRDGDFNCITPLNLFVDNNMKTRVLNQCLVGFLNACRSAQTTFEGGVFVGEIKETLTSIVKPGKAIRKLLNEYHRDCLRRTRRFRRAGRIDPSHIKDANKVVSDTWLEYSFGMAPLFRDVDSGAKALARLSLEPQEYKRASYATSESLPDTQLSASGTRREVLQLFDGIRYVASMIGICSIKSRLTGEVRCKVEDPVTMRSEVLGFDPKSFFPTIYELIPYSFLVDYFSNIGDCINAWTFPLTDISWWSRSTIISREREIVANMISTGVSDVGTYKLGDWNGTDFHIRLDRSRIERDQTVLGIPTIHFQIPGFGRKWLNIGALAHMRKI